MMKKKLLLTFLSMLCFGIANSQTEGLKLKLKNVCTSQTKKYAVEDPEDDIVYHWSVTGGIVIGSKSDDITGNEISVKWADSQGKGKITVYGENPDTKCTSETIVYSLEIKENPSVSFDNSMVCFGEPLKIISSGNAPFEIFYTLDDGSEQSFKTSETEYELPNAEGKYKITKIKDSFCDFSPDRDNEAEILPILKPLKIVEILKK